MMNYNSFVDLVAAVNIYSTSHPPNTKKGQEYNLLTLHTIFIDTLSVNEQFQEEIMQLLGPFGLSMTGNVLVPVVALNEFGGCIIACRDRKTEKADKVPPLTLLIDRLDWKESIINILGFSGDGKKDTDTILGLDSRVLTSTPVVCLTESGYLAHDLTVVIANSDSFGILPENAAGEIWIHSKKFPNTFWSHKDLDDYYFNATPFKFTLEDGKAVSAPLAAPTSFVRTGLMGFVVRKLEGIELKHPRLFVIGSKADRLRQRKPGAVFEVEVKTPTTSMDEGIDQAPAKPAIMAADLAVSEDFNYYFSSQVSETIMLNTEGIEAW